MKKILLILFLTVSVNLLAQKPPAKFGDIPMEDMTMKVYPKDSAAEAVVLADYAESSVAYDQRYGFKLYFERIRRVKILTKEGLDWANFSIPLYRDSDQDEEVTSIKVSTFNLENNKIVETKGKKEMFLKEKFDANLSFLKVAWPNVKVGSVLEISYKLTSEFIFNFQDWEFQTSIPTRWSEYRASIPEYFYYEKYMQGYVTLDISEEEKGNGYLTVDFKTRTSVNGVGSSTSYDQQKVNYIENKYRWAAKDVPAFRKEPYTSNTRDCISKINFELSYTKFPNEFSNPGVKNYMGSWDDISRSYWEKIEPEIRGNNSLKKLVDEIVVGITEPNQQIAAIYDYVKKNVLWDESDGKYLGQTPKRTLDEKKGTSAEINLLLACLLEKAGISVSPVLLSTRDHGYVRDFIPVSSQFNYVVCLAKVGEKSILLDATDKLLPVGMLPERCLNGNGLVVSEQGFQWMNLQPITRTKRVITVDLTLSESGEFKGVLKLDNSGYNAISARRSYFAAGEQEYINKQVKGGSWTISKSEFQNTNELHLSFKEVHELAISEHLNPAGVVMYMSPFLISKMNENPFKLEKRNYPVDFARPFDEIYMAKFTIPSDYVVDELPKSKVITLPQNLARYTYNVSQVGNVINIASNLSVNRSIITAEEYPNLREMFSQIVSKQAEQIVLKKK